MNDLIGYNSKPKPNGEQKRLLAELALPKSKGQKLRRYNVKKLFSDPKYKTLRRYIQTIGTMTIQAREGIDTNWDEVYKITLNNEKL